jgi:hypothetical protein
VLVALGAATKTTFEVPPLPLEETVSQAAVGSSVVDQTQAPGDVTETLPVPPPYGTEEFAEPRA